MSSVADSVSLRIALDVALYPDYASTRSNTHFIQKLGGDFRYGSRNIIVDVRRASSDHSTARHVLTPLDDIMIGTSSASPPLDDAARLRANPAASWGAILAGAAVAVSLSLILLTLGAGLGFASISPWSDHGLSAGAFTVASTIWLIVTQWLSAAMGGYIAGRLRHRWLATHTHEVFFRDTAHGFVTWAVATVIGAIVLAAAASSVVGAGLRTAATVASGAAQAAANSAQIGATMNSYDVDMLFRSPHPDANSSTTDARAETTRILAKGLTTGDVPATDRSYVAELVAARTRISQPDAQKRVDDVIAQLKVAETKAREAADSARKAAAETSIFTALSMLIGAFIACAAAALGGHRRDEHL